jgi:hypothetical protein
MNNEMQLALNAISPSNNDAVTVLINNAPVSVKKDTIKI